MVTALGQLWLTRIMCVIVMGAAFYYEQPIVAILCILLFFFSMVSPHGR